MDKIKPCPFCGRIPELITLEPRPYEYYIQCKCGVEQKLYSSKQNAIKAWNRRSDVDNV